MKIKNMCKKLIICIMVFLVLFNFITSSVGKIDIVYATDDNELTETEAEIEDSLGGVLNGIAGVLTWIPRALIIGVSGLFQLISYFVIDTAGHGDNDVSTFVSPFDIFFNNFTLTDINIFSTDNLDTSDSGQEVVYKIRETAAIFYYVIRVIVIAILLIMLLIIGIKMALSTLAEEKARVKSMFMNWVVSVRISYAYEYDCCDCS